MNGARLPTPTKSFLRVLLVCDPRCDRRSLQRELNQEYEGLAALEVASRHQLSDLVEQGEFDLVIADCPLGRDDEAAVLSAVRQGTPPLPLILFTSADGPEDAVAAMRSGLQNYLAVQGVIDDLTARRRGEATLHRAAAELAHIDRLGALAEMATGIAHEVNQPLSAIANFAMAGIKAIENGDADSAQLLDLLQQISQQSQRAGAMVRRLRGFARRREPQRSWESLNELLQEGIELVACEARRRHITLNFQPHGAETEVFVDRVQIQQVVVNLLRNAFEAMQNAPMAERKVDVCWRLLGDHQIEVSVRDRGAGLPPGDPADFFKPFFTTKSEGLGVGLPMCSTIIRQHGGEIWALPAEPGAEFRFRLPQAQENAQ